MIGGGSNIWRGGRVLFEEKKENFEKVVNFRVRINLALIPCREIGTLKKN